MAQPPVLLTRPRAAAEAVAARLQAAGAERVVVSPLQEIRIAAELPQLAEALIFTSANGVAAYRQLGGPPARPAWCVGPRTAACAAAHGLEVRGMAPDASHLAAEIPAEAPPLLHLRGRHQRGDLVGALRMRGLTASDAVVYDQVACPLTADALAVIATGPVLAPLYSPRSAALLETAVPEAQRAHLQAICLSQAVAEATSLQCLAVAETPDGAAMERAIVSVLSEIGG